MGEIGRDRQEFLYEMSYCDIYLIQRGYRRRNILQYQLQRLQAYGAFHCMGSSDKKPAEWLPLYVDRYIEENTDDDLLSINNIESQEMGEILQELNADAKIRFKKV